MKICKKCSSTNLKVGKAFKKNGSVTYPYYCEDCGTVFPQCIKKTEAAKLNYEIKDVRFKSDIKGYMDNNVCAVCGNKYVELHHFAPVHLFGSEADRWPMAYLCKEHHKQWHDLVTPNMSKKI